MDHLFCITFNLKLSVTFVSYMYIFAAFPIYAPKYWKSLPGKISCYFNMSNIFTYVIIIMYSFKMYYYTCIYLLYKPEANTSLSFSLGKYTFIIYIYIYILIYIYINIHTHISINTYVYVCFHV